ncbi:MAG: hypothetical protein MUE46_13785 [Xanthomonadales bacterium]|jgi:hypothetical protein|nr:hypothetical protein [Xanthomonadales bacterium]
MGYTEIGVAIAGLIFYFNAAKLEARSGASDHSLLWAALSLAVSALTLSLGLGWKLQILAQGVLFVMIAMVRALRDPR